MARSGRFRKKKVNFSMVSNVILRDDTVSLKAKGLYALIQSYITIEGFTLYKSFLQSKCHEGKRSFQSAWDELKEKGYLVQYRMHDERNKFYYEYELLDCPERQMPLEMKRNGAGDTEFPYTHFEDMENEDVQNEGIQLKN